MNYRVQDLLDEHKEALCLHLVAGHNGLKRRIIVPEAHRPGLSLAGFMKAHAKKRILVLGKVEVEYLRHLDADVRYKRLSDLLTKDTPAVMLGRNYTPMKELKQLCDTHDVPLFRVPMLTMTLLQKLTLLLSEAFAPSISLHGTLVEVFGVGVLIKGDSAVGKSEAALGLIERGHRLITDDIVRIKKREGNFLEGFGAELTRYHMEIRGIGIINVANLYGAVCVRDHKSIDLVVKLEQWDDNHFYDRVGLDEKYCDILDVPLPYHILPVKPGRDVVLLLETIALNHRLKAMGYNSAKEFNSKLLETIARKSKRKVLDPVKTG